MSPMQVAWRTLHEGGSDTLVLAVDFATAGRTQAGFPDLTTQWAPRDTVLAALPPTADVPPDAYLDHWLNALPSGASQVTAVLGYCAGAVFAAALADRLAQRQPHPPLLVIFDPELPHAKGLYQDYEASGRSLATMLEPEELRDFEEAAQRTRAAHPDGAPAAVGPELVASYTRAVDAAAERLDLDDDIRDELTGSFTAYVRYLTAASALDPLPAWAARATALTTTPVPHPVAHEERVDTSHENLLRDPCTVRALTDVLDTFEVTRS